MLSFSKYFCGFDAANGRAVGTRPAVSALKKDEASLLPSIETSRLPNRHSIRLPDFDYSRTGVYFVTIDTVGQAHLFGRVTNSQMILNDLGTIADECWNRIPDHHPGTDLCDYIVMPNHVHGLIVLSGNEKEADTAGRVPTGLAPKKESYSKPTKNSIPTIIRSYKSSVSKLVHEEFPGRFEKIWQSRYYERVIRDQKELEAAINYIKSNPANWEAKRQEFAFEGNFQSKRKTRANLV